MDDLEESIARWRAALAAHETIGADAMEELEGHLRDQIGDLVGRGGLGEDEAFLVASRRVGAPGALADEFEVAEPGRVWLVRLFWFTFGYLEISALLALVSALGTGGLLAAAALGAGSALPYYAVAIRLGLFLALIGAVVGAWRYVVRGGLDGFEEMVTGHPVRTAVVALLVLAVLRAGALIAQVALVRLADVETFGRVAVSLSYFGAGSTVLLVVGIAATLALVGKKIGGARTTVGG